jgi:hypothetical protein
VYIGLFIPSVTDRPFLLTRLVGAVEGDYWDMARGVNLLILAVVHHRIVFELVALGLRSGLLLLLLLGTEVLVPQLWLVSEGGASPFLLFGLGLDDLHRIA